MAVNRLGKAVATVADCGVDPGAVVIEATAPALLVRAKLTDVKPLAAAVTLYGPAVVLAVNVVAVATPLASVVACVVWVLFPKWPLAPVPGAVNVTGTPATGLL